MMNSKTLIKKVRSRIQENLMMNKRKIMRIFFNPPQRKKGIV